MEEQVLQTNKGKVFYWRSEAWDAGRDTIFFLHGLTADHSMFEGQISAFAEDFNLLTWDTPAHGKSRPFATFDFGDTSDYIKSILDKYHVDQVIFVGQSLGGFLAQSFIKRYPDRVKCFVSVDSTPYGFDYYSGFDIWILRQVEWMAHLYPFRMMKKAMAKQVSTTRRSYENMMQMLSPYNKSELCHLMGLGYAGFLDDNCELKIPCPVLLILGEKDRTGKVAQYNKAWTQKTGYPLKIIKGAAHNVNVDKPEEVNACIREFLEALYDDWIGEASNEEIIDAVCEYAYELGKQDWHYIRYRLFAPYTHRCPVCSRRQEGKRYGSNCICVPFACWHHGGHIPCRCNTHVINDSNWNRIAELPDYNAALDIARKRIGIRDIMLIRGDNVMNSLRRGDICAHFSGGKYIHSSLYLGEGKMLDCSLEKMHIAVRDALECKFAIRYIGGRNCLAEGDSGERTNK